MLEEIVFFVLVGSKNSNLISVVDNVCLASMKSNLFQIFLLRVEILGYDFFCKDRKTFVSFITLIHLLYISFVEVLAYHFLQLFFLQSDHGCSNIVVYLTHDGKVIKF